MIVEILINLLFVVHEGIMHRYVYPITKDDIMIGTKPNISKENDLHMWPSNRHLMRMALGTTKIYGYTNIYQCGLIMYSLIYLTMGYRAPPYEGYHLRPLLRC